MVYTTDALGRLSTVKVGSTTIATYGYDTQSRVDAVTYGNGAQQDYTYDNQTGWLDSLSLDATGSAKDVTFTYTRDDVGRIKQENISNDGYVFKKHQFTSGQVQYTANENNRYTKIETITQATQSLNPLMYLYDANGNLKDDGAYKYTYDIENRLTEAQQIVGNSTVVVGRYKYDALGRRSEKTSYVSGTTTTRYQWDGETVLAEYNTSNIMQRRYVYGPGIDNPLMVEEADGTKRYLHRDGKGTIVAATDAAGNVTDQFTADPWGNGAEEATSPYRFTARRVDDETGNYYYRNRYYHPKTGRFMSEDPIGYGDGLNMYHYAYNDPVNYSDPLGLSGVVEEISVTGNPSRVVHLSGEDFFNQYDGFAGNDEATRRRVADEVAGQHSQRIAELAEKIKNGKVFVDQKTCVSPNDISEVLEKFLEVLGITQGSISSVFGVVDNQKPLSRRGARAMKRALKQGKIGPNSFIERTGRSLLGISALMGLYNIGEVAIGSDFDSRSITREVTIQTITVGGSAGSFYFGGKLGAASVSSNKRAQGVAAAIGGFGGMIAYGMSGASSGIEENLRGAFDAFYDTEYCSHVRVN